MSKGKFKIDTKQGLSNLQTQFANHLRQRGWHVQRGEVRDPENHQRHITTKEWREEQERLARDARRRLEIEGREVAEKIVSNAESTAQAILYKAEQEAKQMKITAEKKAGLMMKELTMAQREAFIKRQAERDKLEAYKIEKQRSGAASTFISREAKEREVRRKELQVHTEAIQRGIQTNTTNQPASTPNRRTMA